MYNDFRAELGLPRKTSWSEVTSDPRAQFYLSKVPPPSSYRFCSSFSPPLSLPLISSLHVTILLLTLRSMMIPLFPKEVWISAIRMFAVSLKVTSAPYPFFFALSLPPLTIAPTLLL